MGRITDRLAGHARIAIDTSILIYHLEDHPRYSDTTMELMRGIERGQWEASFQRSP